MLSTPWERVLSWTWVQRLHVEDLNIEDEEECELFYEQMCIYLLSKKIFRTKLYII